MRRIRSVFIGVTALLSGALLLPGVAAGAVTPPQVVRASLMNGGMACSTSTLHPLVLGFFATDLEAVGIDKHPSGLGTFDYTFEIWPSADPSAVTAVTYQAFAPGSLGRANLQPDVLTSGDTYSWRVRVADDNGTSAWSQNCVFTYDGTAPSAPTVTSDNYPTGAVGQLGEPAHFTFNGHGDRDVAGFEYGWGELPVLGCELSGPLGQLECPDPLAAADVVRPAVRGGRITIDLNPPGPGPERLVVAALDRAGNRSAPVSYEVFVPFSGPSAEPVKSGAICGDSVRVRFAPHPGVTGVVAYNYSYPNGTTRTVRADTHGRARASVRVDGSFVFLNVQSVSANGFISTPGSLFAIANPMADVQSDIYVDDGQAHGGVGVTGTFTFSPPFSGTGTASYRYQFGTEPSGTVAADPNSQTAEVTYTPSSSGPQNLTVTAVADDGSGDSCSATYAFVVA